MQNFGLGVDDISAESIKSVRDQCADFITYNRADLDAYVEAMGTWRGSDTNRGSDASYSGWESAGIDFLFSSAGHGAGYFDRGLDALGDRLQAAARVLRGSVFLRRARRWHAEGLRVMSSLARTTISETEAERMADAMVIRALARDRAYNHAETAEIQAAREDEISEQVWRDLESRYRIV